MERQSPTDALKVIFLELDLSPGHSGAPLVNDAGEVLGIVDGGLYGHGMHWAIPVTSSRWVDWTDAEDQQGTLLRLKGLGSYHLFAQAITRDDHAKWGVLDYIVPGQGLARRSGVKGWGWTLATIAAGGGLLFFWPKHRDAVRSRDVTRTSEMYDYHRLRADTYEDLSWLFGISLTLSFTGHIVWLVENR